MVGSYDKEKRLYELIQIRFLHKGSPESKSREEKTAPEVLQKSPESSGDLAELHQKLAEKTKEAEENYTRLLRLAADMENLKKRQERERAELLQFANENLIKELLPVVDNLERALDHGRQLGGAGGVAGRHRDGAPRFSQGPGPVRRHSL